MPCSTTTCCYWRPNGSGPARGEIDKATVIVAPIDDLLDRATARTEIEETRPGTPAYPANMWHSILEQVDLFSPYQQLFDVLDAHNIAYDVLFNANGADEMPQTDRCFVHAALRGRHVPLPPQEDIDAVLGFPGVEYQEVLLPRQMTTSHQRFSHTNGSRRQTFDQIADTPLRDRSVLDIGCAMGDMLFWYERFGATQLTGIDLRQSRLDAPSASANCSTATPGSSAAIFSSPTRSARMTMCSY